MGLRHFQSLKMKLKFCLVQLLTSLLQHWKSDENEAMPSTFRGKRNFISKLSVKYEYRIITILDRHLSKILPAMHLLLGSQWRVYLSNMRREKQKEGIGYQRGEIQHSEGSGTPRMMEKGWPETLYRNYACKEQGGQTCRGHILEKQGR